MRVRMSIRRRGHYGFLAAALLSSGALLVGWALMLAGQLGRPVAMDQWVEQSYAYKLALAEGVAGPRALVVAGSGALFGLDSSVLSQALGRPVINLGVNAGVQSQFIRRYAYQAIRPGDWVILPLEYPLYHDRHKANLAFTSYWLSHPGIRSLDLTPVQLARLFWFSSLARVTDGYLGLPESYRVEGLYGPHNLDGRGDQINSEAAKQEVWMRDAVVGSAAQEYGAQANVFQANWDQWAALARAIERQGGCAVFMPPALLYRPEYHAGVELEYYRGLAAEARSHGLVFWGEPLEFMYPEEQFFDTNYHLTAEAREQHSNKVALLLVDAFSACVAR